MDEIMQQIADTWPQPGAQTVIWPDVSRSTVDFENTKSVADLVAAAQLTDTQARKLYEQGVTRAMRWLSMARKVVMSGGSIHQANGKATAKRHAKNRVAKMTRRAQR